MIAVAGAPDGVGGGMTLARAVAGALRKKKHTARIVGWSAEEAAADEPNVASLHAPAWSWRFASLQRTWRLSAWLRQQEPPAGRFIAVSPFWALAAKSAWPDVRVSYAFPCLLASCLPFTWPGGRSPTVWARLDYEHTCRVEHDALEAADRIVVQTAALADEVIAFAPAAQRRVCVCPTGRPDWTAARDAERAAARESLGIDDGETVLLSVGTLDGNKNVGLAIETFAAMRPARVRLLICGDGPAGAPLRERVANAGLTACVQFVGLADCDALSALYAAADALLLTSHYDAFPNAAVEAMTRGRAVIAPRHEPPACVSGIASCVAEHAAGWLYAPGCASSLASTIARICDDRAAVRRRGEAGRRFVESACRWSRYTYELLADR